MPSFTDEERTRIFARAREIVGQIRQRQGAADKYIFMQQCVNELMDQGDTEAFEAENICETLWEEGADFSDYGE